MADVLPSQLREVVAEFESADASIAELVSSSMEKQFDRLMDRSIDALKLAARISASLVPYHLAGDVALGRKIKNIREKKGYLVFDAEQILLGFIEKLEGQHYESLLSCEDLVEALVQDPNSFQPEWTTDIIHEILSEASMGTPADYLWRKIRISGLVVKNQRVREIEAIVKDVQSLYLLGQFRPAVVLCRTLLETALREKLKRDLAPEEVGRWTLRWLLRWVEEKDKYLSRQQLSRAKQINQAASDLVHGRKKVPQVAEESCLKTIKDTFDILETLYAW